MSPTRNRIVTTAVVAAGLFSAVLACSPAAAADPTTPANPPAAAAAPTTPANPGVPGLDMVQQLATAPVNVLQNAASALTGVPATPAPPPGVTAALNLPQPAATPAPGATAGLTLPQLAGVGNGLPGVAGPGGLPVPLPQGLSLPTDLASLVSGLTKMGTQPVSAATAPAASALPGLASLPAAPTLPALASAPTLPGLASAPAQPGLASVSAPAQPGLASLFPTAGLP